MASEASVGSLCQLHNNLADNGASETSGEPPPRNATAAQHGPPWDQKGFGALQTTKPS